MILRWLAILLLLTQVLLPRLHVACGHREHESAACCHHDHDSEEDVGSGSVSLPAEHDDAECLVCQAMQAAAQLLTPEPTSAMVTLSLHTAGRCSAPAARAQAPPDVRGASPRGPPAA